MIKIKSKKRGTCPEVLNNKGENKLEKETAKNNALYDSNPIDYDNRVLKWKIDSNLYGHKKIKEKLLLSQHGKCAFCESNVAHISYGDIEHFRPKKGWVQNNFEKIKGPGYYWLAYDYNNLLFTCQLCNQRYKKNFFPIRRVEFRAKNHHQSSNLLKEKPFFINPLTENPRLLINFFGATAIGVDKNNRGKKTIDALGINRKGNSVSDLYEMRYTHYNLVKYCAHLSSLVADKQTSQTMIDQAKAHMKEYRSSLSQYSAMINDNF